MVDLPPEERRKIYLEEKAKEEQRNPQKSKISENSVFKNAPIVVPALIILSIVLYLSFNKPLSQSSPASDQPPNTTTDQQFCSSALAYLSDFQENAKRVASVLTGINNGTSGQDDVLQALEDGAANDDSAWMQDYAVPDGTAPAYFSEADQKIRSAHEKWQDAMAASQTGLKDAYYADAATRGMAEMKESIKVAINAEVAIKEEMSQHPSN